MLCLHDSIRHNDPAVQRLLSAVEDAPSLSAVILAAWRVARVLTVHLVEAVLAERARHPTLWPRCPQCGAGLRSKRRFSRPEKDSHSPHPLAEVMGTQRRWGDCATRE